MRLFIDGEWNGYRGELISMALVAEDGREFYAVLGCANPEPWVAEHVMPKLGVPPGFLQESAESVQVRLALFLAQFDAAHIVADWPEDIERFCRLLITGPGTRIDTPPLTIEIVRVDAPSKNPHNALADARGLRDSLAIARAADYLRAQADAQPVAWRCEVRDLLTQAEQCLSTAVRFEQWAHDEPPSYLSAWDYEADHIAAEIRAMLAAAPAAPQADRPVRDLLAIIHCDGGHHTEAVGLDQPILDAMEVVIADRLEIAMTKREALSDDEILDIATAAGLRFSMYSDDVETRAAIKRLARAIEREHGIGVSDE